MQRVDIAIAVLAIVALTGSILGVMLYEPPAEPLWDVTFEESGETTWPRPPGAIAAPGSATWALPQENITHVGLTISARGDAAARPQNVQVTVTVTSPAGESHPVSLTLTASSGSAEESLSIPLHDVPTSGEVRAENATAALGATVGLDGTGTWRIQVSAPSGTLPGPLAETITVNVEGTYRFYTGTAQPYVPDISAAG